MESKTIVECRVLAGVTMLELRLFDSAELWNEFAFCPVGHIPDMFEERPFRLARL
ncbi:MAG TPA: hypothetical protein VNL14_20880 [Candidatus Acidoferrales bacterium]|nr:hypothetical protein [Candidatus Acidoferrales bacterium]